MNQAIDAGIIGKTTSEGVERSVLLDQNNDVLDAVLPAVAGGLLLEAGSSESHAGQGGGGGDGLESDHGESASDLS